MFFVLFLLETKCTSLHKIINMIYENMIYVKEQMLDRKCSDLKSIWISQPLDHPEFNLLSKLLTISAITTE